MRRGLAFDDVLDGWVEVGEQVEAVFVGGLLRDGVAVLVEQLDDRPLDAVLAVVLDAVGIRVEPDPVTEAALEDGRHPAEVKGVIVLGGFAEGHIGDGEAAGVESGRVGVDGPVPLAARGQGVAGEGGLGGIDRDAILEVVLEAGEEVVAVVVGDFRVESDVAELVVDLDGDAGDAGFARVLDAVGVGVGPNAVTDLDQLVFREGFE